MHGAALRAQVGKPALVLISGQSALISTTTARNPSSCPSDLLRDFVPEDRSAPSFSLSYSSSSSASASSSLLM
eukprot:9497307-Pyramimonas_sp.AAC.1